MLLPDQHPQENIAPVISVPPAADLMQEFTGTFSDRIHQGARAFTEEGCRPIVGEAAMPTLRAGWTRPGLRVFPGGLALHTSGGTG